MSTGAFFGVKAAEHMTVGIQACKNPWSAYVQISVGRDFYVIKKINQSLPRVRTVEGLLRWIRYVHVLDRWDGNGSDIVDSAVFQDCNTYIHSLFLVSRLCKCIPLHAHFPWVFMVLYLTIEINILYFLNNYVFSFSKYNFTKLHYLIIMDIH